MHASGAIALGSFVTPTAIQIGPGASSMIRALPFEPVPDAEPFFISLR